MLCAKVYIFVCGFQDPRETREWLEDLVSPGDPVSQDPRDPEVHLVCQVALVNPDNQVQLAQPDRLDQEVCS